MNTVPRTTCRRCLDLGVVTTAVNGLVPCTRCWVPWPDAEADVYDRTMRDDEEVAERLLAEVAL